MALEFRRRRFRLPGKKGQFALAVAVLLLAIALLAGWIVVSYHMDKAKMTPSSTDSGPSVVDSYTRADTVNLLVMLTDRGQERFTLIQAAPATPALRVMAVPETMDVGDGQTLAQRYRKSGAAAATAAVAETLELPVAHYMALTGENTEKWFNYLENGIPVTLPEAVNTTDENGSILRLNAGEHTVTATQAVGLLRYTGWRDAENNRCFHAQIIAVMLQRYYTPQRRFAADFARLSNLCKTDLRIGDFQDAQAKLEYLAGCLEADGGMLHLVILPGSETDGRFVLDENAARRSTGLYD